MRDYIHKSLYDEKEGYFCRSVSPVGYLKDPIPFHELSGQEEYFDWVRQQYDDLERHWLTPVEIFSPHVGSCLGSYMLSRLESSKMGDPLRIVEIGGGTGTLSRDVLEWLRQHHEDVYASCRYTSIEISSNLAEMQENRVKQDHSMFSVVQGDAADPSTWSNVQTDSANVVVIAMEVLDNLPHDKVTEVIEENGDHLWVQSLVYDSAQTREAEGRPTEVQVLMDDPYIRRALHTWIQHKEEGKQHHSLFSFTRDIFDRFIDSSGVVDPVFLPTGALQLFDTLHSCVPQHQLIAADFDHLPDVVIPGKNAPLVSSRIDGSTKDRSTIFVPLGSADIFFPTDFSYLSQLYHDSAIHCHGRSDHIARSIKAKEFFETELQEDRHLTQTASGYNPLLDDYTNTSFLLTSFNSGPGHS